MEAQVNINGPIVLAIEYDPATGAPKEWPVTTVDMVQEQLNWQKPYDSIRVIINSPGGHVAAGLGIYDLLRAQPVEVTTEALGQCSSIATVVFLAGTKRRAYQNVNFMVHYPYGEVGGDGTTVIQYGQELLDLQAQILGIYTGRTGSDEATINGMMAVETTIPVPQILSLGFATEIVQPIMARAQFTPASNTSPTTAGANPATPAPMTVVNRNPPAAPTPAAAAALAAAAKQTPLARTWAKAEALFKRGPVLAMAVTTAAGDALTIDTGDRTTYEVGDAVFTADGGVAPDADYVLEDGATITVVSGLISAIVPAATAAAAAAAPVAAAAPAQPTTLAEALEVIKQMQAGTTAAPAQAAAAPVVAAAAAPAAVVATDPVAVHNARMAALMNQMGALMVGGAVAPLATDSSNPSMVATGKPAAGAVANANSPEAKEAAMKRMQAKASGGGKAKVIRNQ